MKGRILAVLFTVAVIASAAIGSIAWASAGEAGDCCTEPAPACCQADPVPDCCGE